MMLIENASKRVVRMWSMSLDTWNNILLGFLALAAFAAAVVGLATYATIHLADAESAKAKADLETYKLLVDGKVSDARAEGIKAGKLAGDAVVRAAQLQKEAEVARLETEKIKEVVAWRVISSHEQILLREFLNKKSGSVNLRYTDGDPESLFLAIQIGNLLVASNWKVASGAQKTSSLVFGLNLPDPPNEDMEILRAAFTAAGIPFSTQRPPDTAFVGFMIATIAGAPTLMVGSRPPPILQ